MSAPLIPLTIAGTPYPAYTIQTDTLVLNTTPAGPPAPARITRARGDHGPHPAPLRARIEILGTNLTDAYTNAYAALESAKAAAGTGARVTWYGGAFDLLDVTNYDMEPTSAESVTLTLELLPAHEPTHYGHLLPIRDTDARANLWSVNAAPQTVTNASPALARPNTPARRTVSPGSGHYMTDYPLAANPPAYPDAAPYDPDRIDAVGIIRCSALQTYGIHLSANPGNLLPIAAVITQTTFGIWDINDNVVLASAPHGYTITALEWWAIRLTATRLTGTNYRYEAKMWNARTRPQGEPAGIQAAANRDKSSPLTAAGAYMNIIAGQWIEVPHLALAYGGAPAPTINP